MMEENPLLEIDDDFISLVDINDESLDLVTTFNKFKQVAKTSFISFVLAASSGDISQIPTDASEAVKKISNFNQKWDCTAHFGYNLNGFNEISSFSKVKNIKDSSFKETKTFYGELKRIGGDNPVANIKLHNGKWLNAKISRQQALDYNDYLYKEVIILGVAKYSNKSLKILEFDASNIEPYESVAISDTISIFRKAHNA